MKRINLKKIPNKPVKSILFLLFCIIFISSSQCHAGRGPLGRLFDRIRNRAGIETPIIQPKKKKKKRMPRNYLVALSEGATKVPLVTRKNIQERKVLLKTSDGLVRKGVLTLVPKPKGNVILCHPATMDKNFMIPYQEKVFSQYNCLRFDFRKHGEDIENQYTTIGKYETRDVDAAVKLLREYNRTSHLPTYGFGISLGAVVLIEAESKNPSLDGLIVQAPFEKLRNQIKRIFPFYQRPFMHNFIHRQPSRIYAKFKYNVKLRKVKPYLSIRKIKTPIFLIQSQNDWLIPMKSFNCLVKNGKQCIKKTWNPEKGQHSAILQTYPKKFIQLCNEFLEEIYPREQA